jgi:hypothetical protein
MLAFVHTGRFAVTSARHLVRRPEEPNASQQRQRPKAEYQGEYF